MYEGRTEIKYIINYLAACCLVRYEIKKYTHDQFELPKQTGLHYTPDK